MAVPSVRMNAGSFQRATRRPLAKPTARPMSSTTATASGMFSAFPAMSVAASTEANEMTAPTERSTPPVIITRVTPTAAMPTTLAWRSTLKKFTGWMKPGESQAATRMMASERQPQADAARGPARSPAAVGPPTPPSS